MSASGRDSDRSLTEDGVRKTTRVAKTFAKKVPELDLIVHSPYLRARQTAEIFAGVYPDVKMKESKNLVPMEKARMVLPLLSGLGESKKVMLVGHEPNLSSLASLLITGSERPVLEFKRAGIAGISCSGILDHAYLMFLLTPKMLL